MNNIKKGFTLIELLITIAIVGILSAAVLVGINPVQKLKQANDSKIKSDIGQVATAAQSYAAANSTGLYPTTGEGVAKLVSSGDLAATPATAVDYAANAGATAFRVYFALNAPATASDVWCFQSSTGIASEKTVLNCTP